jgi:threonine/homoserine/homoserine lactone efflux protein
MNISFFHAMIAGLALAAPVGPVGLVCIRRTLSRGMLSGLMSGMGAAVVDALYASVAAFGVTIIFSALARYASFLELAGGLLLCALGVHAIRSHKVIVASDAQTHSVYGDFVSTFALTLTNPATIIGFAALFSVLGLTGEEGNRHGAIVLVAGVFTGSTLWWLILSLTMHHIRHFLSEHTMHWINLISGSALVVIGVAVMVAGCLRLPSFSD